MISPPTTRAEAEKVLTSDSQWILALKYNWDDECGLPYSESVLSKALSFALDHCGINLPTINPGPGTSIDVHWREEGLLANVSADEPTPFYGEGNDPIKGSINQGEVSQEIIDFLSKQHAKKVNEGMSEKNINEVFGNNVRHWRKHADMTQAELAHAVGLSRVSVVNIEAGRHEVRINTLFRISNALDCRPEMLLDIHTSAHEPSPQKHDRLTRRIMSRTSHLSNGSKKMVGRFVGILEKAEKIEPVA